MISPKVRVIRGVHLPAAVDKKIDDYILWDATRQHLTLHTAKENV